MVGESQSGAENINQEDVKGWLTQKTEVPVKVGLRIDADGTEPNEVHSQGAIGVLGW